MDPLSSPTPGALNSLVIERKLQAYREQPELAFFWDILADCVASERAQKELADNNEKYFGNITSARNALIRHDLNEAGLYANAREMYATITTKKILESFRKAVFSWSTGGKNYANEGNADLWKHEPKKYLEELYDANSITEVEALSEHIDQTVLLINEEFHWFEMIRSCAQFYIHMPSGKYPAIYRDCLEIAATLSAFVREAKGNESYFQNAVVQVRQYRDMLDPIKEVSEDFRRFIAASDKPTSHIQHDIEAALAQYITTLISFAQMQKKESKEELKIQLNGFLAPTGYTINNLGFDIAPTYNSTMDKVLFKRAGWELHPVPVKK